MHRCQCTSTRFDVSVAEKQDQGGVSLLALICNSSQHRLRLVSASSRLDFYSLYIGETPATGSKTMPNSKDRQKVHAWMSRIVR
jgi:hypothetical protein